MRAFPVFCLIFLVPLAARAEPDYRAIALAAVDGRIVPGYLAFQDGAEKLTRRTDDFCADPQPALLGPVQAAFHQAMDAWQGVQAISYGPVEAFNRGQRVQFWPDKKNAGDRQMRLLLKSRDGDSLTPSRIAFASVAVQGFPALETLLFGRDQTERLSAGDEDAAFRCRLMSAVAGNLAAMGRELARDWTKVGGFRAAIADAGGPSSPFVDHRQTALKLFNALHGQLEAIAEVKLAHPLGADPDAARAQRAESWRSNRSLRNIVLNLEAQRAIAEIAFLPALRAAGRENAGKALLAALDDALAAARSVSSPMETAMATPDGRRGLDGLKAKVKAVARILDADIGQALDMQVGFNALDGD